MSQSSFCAKLDGLRNAIYHYHYAPKLPNDQLSEVIYDLFLEEIDENRHFLFKEDTIALSVHRTELDNYIRSSMCNFITDFAFIYEKRVQKALSIVENLREVDLDYMAKDTLYFDHQKRKAYFKDSLDYQKYWSKKLRYKIVSDAITQNSNSALSMERFDQMEPSLKSKAIDKLNCEFNEILQKENGLSSYIEDKFLTSFAKAFDPHTQFFSPSEKESFYNTLSSKELSFGLMTSKNDHGQIEIVELTPGGPAYKQGILKKGDIVLSLQKETTTLEVNCISEKDILNFLNVEENKQITFRVKQKRGTIVEAKLMKEAIDVQENEIGNFLVAQYGKNFGYLNIPGFYADFESSSRKGAANDVAKILFKLKKDTIQGLIIDLRYNGGGAMREATKIAGMFINKGPLLQLRSQGGRIFTIKDQLKGSIFQKPLVILINEHSASAAEYLAMILKDYNRAIIIGSTSYGKATTQHVFPLSKSNRLGFAKITSEKFYSATGQSYQAKGIIPDIELPSLYKGIGKQEKDEAQHLPNDVIAKTSRFKPLLPLPIEQLRKKSEERTLHNHSFSKIKTINTEFVSNYINSNKSYALTFENINTDIQNFNMIWNMIETLEENNQPLTMQDLVTKKKHTKSGNNIKIDVATIKDSYIKEAFAILSDMISNTETAPN